MTGLAILSLMPSVALSGATDPQLRMAAAADVADAAGACLSAGGAIERLSEAGWTKTTSPFGSEDFFDTLTKTGNDAYMAVPVEARAPMLCWVVSRTTDPTPLVEALDKVLGVPVATQDNARVWDIDGRGVIADWQEQGGATSVRIEILKDSEEKK